MPRSCVKILDTVVLESPDQLLVLTLSVTHLLIAACTCSTFPGAVLVAGLPECGSLSTDSWLSWKYLCHNFICAALIASSPKAFWVIRIVSVEECSSLMQNLMLIRHSTHFLKRFYLFIFREKGREGEREKYQCVIASRMSPTGDLACNPGMCPNQKLNWRPFTSQSGAQSTEPHQPGLT